MRLALSLRATLLAALLVATCAHAAILLPPLTPNYDATLSTKYPNGDKPQSTGTCPPDGWTLLKRGTADGQICDVAGDFNVTVSGQDDEGDQLQVYQTCGTGDCEVIARIPAVSEWSGHLETFTSFLVGISEGTGDSAWYFQAWVTPDGRPRCKAGTPGPDDYNASGSANQLPEYIAVTHDDDQDELRCLQSDDGVTWSTYGTFSRDLAEPAIGYVGGTSHDASASTSATLGSPSLGTSITTYVPDGPDPPDPGNHAPVCQVIANQQGTQGQAISTVQPDCTDEDAGDTLAFSATGLSGRGLSINSTTGAITGTPNATAVSASPFTVTVTATDPDGAQGQAVFQFSISPSTGATYNVATGAATIFDCQTQGVKPGDSVVLAGGVHNTIRQFRNCHGSSSSYITIRNDTSSGSRTTIRVPSGRPRYGFALVDTEYVKVTGLGGWSGQTTGDCGVDDDKETRRTNKCGIYIDGATNGGAQSMVMVQGLSRFITIEGIELGADWSGPGDSSANATTGFELKESDRCATDHPGEWREGIVLRKFYVHNTRAAHTYFGTNETVACDGIKGNTIENRNWVVEYGLFVESGSNGLHAKRFPSTDPNTLVLRYLDIENIGGSPSVLAEGATNRPLSCADASCKAYGIRVKKVYEDTDVDGPGMVCVINNRPASDGTQRCEFTDSLVIDAQGVGVNASRAASGVHGTNAGMSVDFSYLTVINSGGNCINAASGVTGTVRNDICAGSTASSRNIGGSGLSKTNNLQDSVGNLGFVNAAGGNYKLTSGSPARNAAVGACSDQDVIGKSRPQQGVCDIGAYEYVP